MVNNSRVPASRSLYSRLRPSPWSLEDVLRLEIEPGWSVLDLGCGPGRPLADAGLLPEISATGVDGHIPSLETATSRGYTAVHESDLRGFLSEIAPGAYDCSMAIDVVEHFPKEQGFDFIAEMIRAARHKVVIMTPNGFVPQEPAPDNPHQEHLSGWLPEEFAALGFQRVYGINGLKRLRGPYAAPTIRPNSMGLVLSEASQLVARKRPSLAYHFVAVLDRTVQ